MSLDQAVRRATPLVRRQERTARLPRAQWRRLRQAIIPAALLLVLIVAALLAPIVSPTIRTRST